MNAGQFANYAVHKCGCRIEPHSNENIIWITNPNKGGASCYVMCKYKSLYYESIVRHCIRLRIEIISEKDYLDYE